MTARVMVMCLKPEQVPNAKVSFEGQFTWTQKTYSRSTTAMPGYTVLTKFLLAMLAVAIALSATPVVGADHDHELTIWETLLQKSGGENAMDHNPDDYDILIAVSTELDVTVQSDDPVTLFAPNDRALYTLARLAGYKTGYDEKEISDFLINNIPPSILTANSQYSVVPYAMSSDDIRDLARDNGSMSTLLEDAVIVPRESGGKIYLDDLAPFETKARVIRPYDIQAKNGFIHTINRALYATRG
jgi:uncharacterized surface protein with fasciclin (FAS1) repeats